MTKRLKALLLAAAVSLSLTACSGKDNTSSSSSSSSVPASTQPAATNAAVEQATAESMSDDSFKSEEGASAHISPMETISSNLGCKVDVNTVVPHTDGSNTYNMPIADFVNEGDYIRSFTFIVYGVGGNINDFKGGFGISLLDGCPAETTPNWYQTGPQTIPTQGGYGEIRWDVPPEVAEYVNVNGEVQFGYYWGDCDSVKLDSVFCEYTRTVNVPADGTQTVEVGQTVNFDTDSISYEVPLDFLPEDTVPEAVTVDLSAAGPINMFQGQFEYQSPIGTCKGDKIGLFTPENTLQLTWFLTNEMKQYYAENGTIKLSYWYGGQKEITMNTMTVRYSNKDTSSVQEVIGGIGGAAAEDTGFRSASQIVEAMNVGWNLGNALDSYNTGLKGLETETGWGNPKTTQEMVRSVKSAGFNTIRIPVTWGEHMVGNTIQGEWLTRVQEVVDYAYNEGLFVIIDVHHDDYLWITPNNSEYANDSEKLKAIWTQISERFKDYGDRLIFEGLNEPKTIGSAMEWMGGTLQERSVINNFEADFVKTVRSSGGNNAGRTLIVTSYAASAESMALKDVIIPKNGNIIFSVHYYAPWKFSEGNDTVFDAKGREELDKKFSELKEKFIDKGIPVIIDEFGCVNAADEKTRADYYKYYVGAAKKLGIKCVVWDNGSLKGDGSFGIFSRTDCKWNTAILNGIMEGAES
ncbi:MAG: cellulase family glycosylhydrolase [Ruminococcus flavefaciens]